MGFTCGTGAKRTRMDPNIASVKFGKRESRIKVLNEKIRSKSTAVDDYVVSYTNVRMRWNWTRI